MPVASGKFFISFKATIQKKYIGIWIYIRKKQEWLDMQKQQVIVLFTFNGSPRTSEPIGYVRCCDVIRIDCIILLLRSLVADKHGLWAHVYVTNPFFPILSLVESSVHHGLLSSFSMLPTFEHKNILPKRQTLTHKARESLRVMCTHALHVGHYG